jgi:hypothetical protein
MICCAEYSSQNIFPIINWLLPSADVAVCFPPITAATTSTAAFA